MRTRVFIREGSLLNSTPHQRRAMDRERGHLLDHLRLLKIANFRSASGFWEKFKQRLHNYFLLLLFVLLMAQYVYLVKELQLHSLARN